MLLTMLKAKLHQACVTHSEPNYEGSCAIDEELLELINILPNEQIQIYNITNGNRFTTYAISAPRGSKIISVNGAAALLANPKDRVIIVSYAAFEESIANQHRPKIAFLDEKNSVKSTKNTEINALVA